MKEKLVFKNTSRLSYVLPIIIGVLLCLVFGILIIADTNNSQPLYLLPAFVGVLLIGFPQVKYVRSRNIISHGNSGITAKLLGKKTFGFEFSDVEQVDFIENDLIIRVKRRDVITLSRKRYNHNSLQQLYTLIQQKTRNNER